MQDVTLNRDQSAPTQSAESWSEDEIAILREVARGNPHYTTLQMRLPGRTYCAIKTKLMVVRREMGVPKRGKTDNLEPGQFAGPAMLDPEDPGMATPHWLESQRPHLERANAAFLNAMLQLVPA